MSGTAGGRRARRIGAALLAACLVLTARPALAQQAPPFERSSRLSSLAGDLVGAEASAVTVGQVTAIAQARDLDLAVALAEIADRPSDWYGLGRVTVTPLSLVVVRGEAAFHRAGRGQVPRWGVGLALPGARLIAVRADGGDDPVRVLRHELAHFALRQSIRGRVPLWFDEGYAVLAAGEFDRFDRLALNLGVMRGAVPSLGELNNALRGNRHEAETAYALAASAVAFLARGSRDGTLAPLLGQLAQGVPFDSAVVRTAGYTRDRFDEGWQRDVRRRYNWGLWLAAGGIWSVVGGLLVFGYWWRRRRDRPRRAALDIGWDVSIGDEETAPTLDRT